MDAITKNWISEEQIQQMTDQALGHPVAIQNIKRLSGGFCSAVYLVETAEEKMVLKLASGTGVKVMRNEVKYIPTEAEMLKLFQERLFRCRNYSFMMTVEKYVMFRISL